VNSELRSGLGVGTRALYCPRAERVPRLHAPPGYTYHGLYLLWLHSRRPLTPTLTLTLTLTLALTTLTLAAAHALPPGPARRACTRAHQLARLRSRLARRDGAHPTAGAQAPSAMRMCIVHCTCMCMCMCMCTCTDMCICMRRCTAFSVSAHTWHSRQRRRAIM